MSNDNKTLADVQPGGRVRLGDQALSTSEGARRYVADYFATQLSRHDFGDYILTELAADFACALAHHLSAQPSQPSSLDLEAMLATCVPGGSIVDPQVVADNIRHWFAAQPSPGGQGGALEALAKEMDEFRTTWGTIGMREFGYFVDTLKAALAARQPVGEPVAWMARPVLQSARSRSSVFCSDSNLASQWDYSGHPEYGRMTVTPLYAAPPAQAVDLSTLERFECQLYENPWPYSKMDEVDGGDWVRFDDVKALIDSQAVGK